MHGFYIIKYANVSIGFEGRTERSMEVLMRVCVVFAVGCMHGFS